MLVLALVLSVMAATGTGLAAPRLPSESAAAQTAVVGLKKVGRLRGRGRVSQVHLSWRDRSRGEDRYEVRVGRRTKRLPRNTRRHTARRLRPATSYRFRVRACRRKRCARWVVLTVRTRAITPPPAAGGGGPPAPVIGGCQIFPGDNAWNQDVSLLPRHPNSDAFIASLAGLRVQPDFGSGRHGDYGIPFLVVPEDEALIEMNWTEAWGAKESDPGPYPMPLDAPIEGGANSDGDRHVIVLRQGDCKLFEIWKGYPNRSLDRWDAVNGAVFDLTSNALRPEGWTSADAAGLPILPGLARADEVASGAITHALRFTVPRTQHAYIHPATHWACNCAHDSDNPPMGLRLRLKANQPISHLTGQSRVIAEALKRYGMLVADNGGRWLGVSGTQDTAWSDDDLDQLKTIPATAFEAVDTGPLESR